VEGAFEVCVEIIIFRPLIFSIPLSARYIFQ
jgi:hypothetical protein